MLLEDYDYDEAESAGTSEDGEGDGSKASKAKSTEASGSDSVTKDEDKESEKKTRTEIAEAEVHAEGEEYDLDDDETESPEDGDAEAERKEADAEEAVEADQDDQLQEPIDYELEESMLPPPSVPCSERKGVHIHNHSICLTKLKAWQTPANKHTVFVVSMDLMHNAFVYCVRHLLWSRACNAMRLLRFRSNDVISLRRNALTVSVLVL